MKRRSGNAPVNGDVVGWHDMTRACGEGGAAAPTRRSFSLEAMDVAAR